MRDGEEQPEEHEEERLLEVGTQVDGELFHLLADAAEFGDD
jgi:hypothetical protein